MAVDSGPDVVASQKSLLDVLIRAGLVAVLVIVCYRVFHPFMDLLLWSIILAVTLYPLQRRWRRRFGMKEGRTATLIVILAIVLLIVPVYLVGTSIAASVEQALSTVRSGSVAIPPPPAHAAEWPVIGKPLHAMWTQAATDMSVLTQKFAPQIKAMTLTVLGKIAGVTLGLLLFIFALILAGFFLAYGESGHRSAVRAFSRAFGPGKGEHVAELCTATIRAVAQGVIGIAFIQMLLIGIGFAIMGVPAAGLLAIVVLLLGIMQIPATLITLPVIAYVLTTQGITGATIIFSIYVFVAGLVDNVLKPLMLGRGVDVPMPVVLIGALGGMVTSGILGLFLGPVILAIGYELFWQWVDDAPFDVEPAEPDKAGVSQLSHG